MLSFSSKIFYVEELCSQQGKAVLTLKIQMIRLKLKQFSPQVTTVTISQMCSGVLKIRTLSSLYQSISVNNSSFLLQVFILSFSISFASICLFALRQELCVMFGESCW